MSQAPGITTHRPAPAAGKRRRWWSPAARGRHDGRNVRRRRVLLILVLIWIVGVFDLVFTLMARKIDGFHEANPLARQFIDSPGALAIFKFASLSLATVIFLLFSRRLITEIGCWFVAGVYVVLAFVWLIYYGA